MTHYNLIVIGFGKAGKTLAKYASSQGQQVALIEQFTESYGGTCINVKCVYFHIFMHKKRPHLLRYGLNDSLI